MKRYSPCFDRTDVGVIPGMILRRNGDYVRYIDLPRVHNLRKDPNDLPNKRCDTLMLCERENGKRYVLFGEYLHRWESQEIGDWEDDHYLDWDANDNPWLPEGWYSHGHDDEEMRWLGDRPNVIAWQDRPSWEGVE